jgi:putative spermidine/putrescine transport system ATP-binding protein
VLAGAPIRVDGVSKTYGDHAVLEDVRLDVEGGEFLTLLGASGSGKSTLLNILAGFVKADTGRITVDGADLTSVPPHRRGLGMVFQHYALFPHMSVAENVAFPLKRQKVRKDEVRRRVGEALEMVELGDLGARKPTELSGGQQQRVALARAIVSRPRVLLMDEPLGALDKMLREQLQLEIRRLHREMGITFVFVTHDQDEAITMSDRIALLRKGEIVQVGTPAELYGAPNCRYVAEFVGVSNIFTGSVDGAAFVDARNAQKYRLPAGQLAAGSALMVRPERLTVLPLHQAPVPAYDAVEGTVVDCVYQGSDRSVHVLTEGGDRLVARTAVPRGDDGIRTGVRVHVCWDVEDARVLA